VLLFLGQENWTGKYHSGRKSSNSEPPGRGVGDVQAFSRGGEEGTGSPGFLEKKNGEIRRGLLTYEGRPSRIIKTPSQWAVRKAFRS